MKRDLAIAGAFMLCVIALGLLVAIRPQSSQVSDLNDQIVASNHRISMDREAITSFPSRLRTQRLRFAPLRRVDIAGTDTAIESHFLISFDALVRRNHVGMRPVTLAPTFTAVASPQPSGSTPPAPAPSASPIQNRPAPTLQATPAPPPVPGALGAAALPPGAQLPPQLLHNDGSLEVSGCWQNVLHSIDELTELPVLLQINSVSLTREVAAGQASTAGSSAALNCGRDPQLDAKISFSLFKVSE